MGIELLLFYNFIICYGSVSSITGRFPNKPPLLLVLTLEFIFDVVFVVLVTVLLSIFSLVPFVWAITYSKEIGLLPPVMEINMKKENDKNASIT